MASFASEVFKQFSALIEKHEFKPAKGLDYDAFASLVRRSSQDICNYIFVRDDRSGRGDLSAQLWVAPIDFPDDGLDKLGVGFKIWLGATRQLEENFLPGLVKRVEILLPATEALAASVIQEFSAPIFPTRKIYTYRLERTAFDFIREFSATTAGSYWKDAFGIARSVTLGKGKYSQLEKKCVECAERLFHESTNLTRIDSDYFERNPKFTGSRLSKQIYIETLVGEWIE